jgi:hypothetical protein
MQTPLPLQVIDGPHAVPKGYNVHAPVLHCPVVPQVLGACVAHVFPHVPQFAGSVTVFTQAVPQNVSPAGHAVVVVVVLVSVVVVLAATISGAQRIFGVLGVNCRSPNWSCHCTAGSVAFGHFSL